MRAKIFNGIAAGRDSDGACSDDLATGDVMWSVADHKNPVGSKTMLKMCAGAPKRVRSEFVSVLRIVRKRTKRERIPKAEMTKLDLSALPEITGKQALGDVRMFGNLSDDLGHTRQDSCAGIMHLLCKRPQIAVEKTLDVFRCSRAQMMFQDPASDPYVGSTEVFEPFQCILHAKFASKREAQTALAGATGVDQGAVDIPEQKCFHRRTFIFVEGHPACEPKLLK